MLYVTINKNMFIDYMDSAAPGEFSYTGLCILYDHLEGLSQYNDIEIDPLEICQYFDEITREEVLEVYDLPEDCSDGVIAEDLMFTYNIIGYNNGVFIVDNS